MIVNDTDYAGFQKKYIELVSGNVMDKLVDQKDFFTEMLEALTEQQLDFRYEDNKWSLRELLVHCIDTEAIFNYRALCIMRGETQTLPGFDQDDYVKNASINHYNKEYIINYFTITRYNTLVLFKNMDPELWEREGHVADYTMKLKAIPAVIAGHLEHHIRVIKDKYFIK